MLQRLYNPEDIGGTNTEASAEEELVSSMNDILNPETEVAEEPVEEIVEEVEETVEEVNEAVTITDDMIAQYPALQGLKGRNVTEALFLMNQTLNTNAQLQQILTKQPPKEAEKVDADSEVLAKLGPEPEPVDPIEKPEDYKKYQRAIAKYNRDYSRLMTEQANELAKKETLLQRNESELNNAVGNIKTHLPATISWDKALKDWGESQPWYDPNDREGNEGFMKTILNRPSSFQRQMVGFIKTKYSTNTDESQIRKQASQMAKTKLVSAKEPKKASQRQEEVELSKEDKLVMALNKTLKPNG